MRRVFETLEVLGQLACIFLGYKLIGEYAELVNGLELHTGVSEIPVVDRALPGLVHFLLGPFRFVYVLFFSAVLLCHLLLRRTRSAAVPTCFLLFQLLAWMLVLLMTLIHFKLVTNVM